jgi:hypothetical protein
MNEQEIVAFRKEKADKLLASSLVIAINLYGLSTKFGKMIYKVANQYSISYNILEAYNCFTTSNSNPITLFNMPNPVLIRPCNKLNSIMLSNEIITLPKEFEVLEKDPSPFNQMLFSYRTTYDALFGMRLLLHDSGINGEYRGNFTDVHAKEFLDNTTLYQLNRELNRKE